MKHLEAGFKDKNIFLKPLIIILVLFISIIIITPLISFFESIISPNSNFIKFLILGVLIPSLVLLLTFNYLLKILYKKSIIFVINGTDKIRWNKIFYGFYLWGLIILCQIFLGYFLDGDNYSLNINLENFTKIFLLCVIVFPIQCGFEEIFCRGYLLQIFGSWSNNRWISLIISSLVFGALHISNPEVKSYGLIEMLANYFCIGLIFGLVTIIDDGTEIAIGAHTANNIIACSIISFPSSVLENDSAIFFLQNVSVPSVAETVVGMTFTGFLFIFFLKRKYNLKSLNDIDSKVVIHD